MQPWSVLRRIMYDAASPGQIKVASDMQEAIVVAPQGALVIV